jgi:hypothetical protein
VVWRAPDDGHCNARNMLSSVCTTKQYILGLIVASSWLFYLSTLQFVQCAKVKCQRADTHSMCPS